MPKKWAEKLLDGYVRLLDACYTTRDLFSQIKQNVQELLSVLRRKDADDLAGYLISRRKAKKIINRALKDSKSIRNRQAIFTTLKDYEAVAVLSMLKEIESISPTMFESLLSYITGTKMQSRQGGWSLVSKLINTSSVSDQD